MVRASTRPAGGAKGCKRLRSNAACKRARSHGCRAAEGAGAPDVRVPLPNSSMMTNDRGVARCSMDTTCKAQQVGEACAACPQGCTGCTVHCGVCAPASGIQAAAGSGARTVRSMHATRSVRASWRPGPSSHLREVGAKGALVRRQRLVGRDAGQQAVRQAHGRGRRRHERADVRQVHNQGHLRRVCVGAGGRGGVRGKHST